MKKKQKAGRSLNPSKATKYYNTIVHQFKTFNKNQRLGGQPELTFSQYLYNNNLDLSGRTLIEL